MSLDEDFSCFWGDNFLVYWGTVCQSILCIKSSRRQVAVRWPMWADICGEVREDADYRSSCLTTLVGKMPERQDTLWLVASIHVAYTQSNPTCPIIIVRSLSCSNTPQVTNIIIPSSFFSLYTASITDTGKSLGEKRPHLDGLLSTHSPQYLNHPHCNNCIKL